MQPSLTIFTPAYSAPVPIPEIGRVVTGRASSIKNTLGCMAGLTVTLVCVPAAGLLVVI